MMHTADLDLPRRLLYHPYAQILPWLGLVGLLAVLWVALDAFVIAHYRAERSALERERTDVRLQFAQHTEARRIRTDMARVLAALPLQRDFAPLALGLTEQAKANRVHIPGLTYQVEKTDVPGVSKAVLQGSVTGRYEDIRLFIHNLETAEELILIETLDVDRAGHADQVLTVNLQIVTYLRSIALQPVRM
ncbi:hypothetical protein YTPLAS18_23860 [Nitrospira sp.]|nr:hypothetical protein YTPLAS18_23860 [Nitrospira sp.]